MPTPLPLPGRRFGLTADTHDDLADWPAALAALRQAWGAVDGVLHCGDITHLPALADLAGIAPVYATRSQDDPAPQPPLLTDGPRTFRIGELTVGLVFQLGKAPLDADTARAAFGERVDVCIFGGSHQPRAAVSGGVLYVNPGSPSLAKQRTTAVLTVEGGVADVEIIPIP
jgi:putative phosphoesterase